MNYYEYQQLVNSPKKRGSNFSIALFIIAVFGTVMGLSLYSIGSFADVNFNDVFNYLSGLKKSDSSVSIEANVESTDSNSNIANNPLVKKIFPDESMQVRAEKSVIKSYKRGVQRKTRS